MINSHAIAERDSFFEEHGDYVLTEGFYLFADGALVEDNPLGRLIPPSDDGWERAKLIARYWQLVAEHTENQFIAFKSYLSGEGKREAEWATLYTDGERIAHLRQLQQRAKQTRAKYRKAKRDAKEATPFWIVQRERDDAEDAKRRQEFRDRIDSVQL